MFSAPLGCASAVQNCLPCVNSLKGSGVSMSQSSGDLPKAGYLVSLDWLIITTLLILVLLYVSILADWYMVVWAKTDIYTIRTIDFFVCVTLAVVYVVIFISLFLWYECCTCCSSSSRKKKKRSPKVKKKVKPLS